MVYEIHCCWFSGGDHNIGADSLAAWVAFSGICGKYLTVQNRHTSLWGYLLYTIVLYIKTTLFIRPQFLVPSWNIFVLYNLYFKTTCNARLYLHDPMGGLKTQGSLYQWYWYSDPYSDHLVLLHAVVPDEFIYRDVTIHQCITISRDRWLEICISYHANLKSLYRDAHTPLPTACVLIWKANMGTCQVFLDVNIYPSLCRQVLQVSYLANCVMICIIFLKGVSLHPYLFIFHEVLGLEVRGKKRDYEIQISIDHRCYISICFICRQICSWKQSTFVHGQLHTLINK